MELSEHAEEVLEELWTQKEKEGRSTFNLNSLAVDKRHTPIHELVKLDLIVLSGDQIHLTTKGESEAANVVRRHRLAERLLVDVLDTKGALLEETACKLEHLIKSGIEENICSLLGHPEVCPHGNPIPKGKCCLEGYDKAGKIVVALSQLQPEEEGRIAYISARERKRLQKLMAMGVTPGTTVRLIQRFPSYVFQMGETQIALDETIADQIFLLKTKS